MHRNVEIGDKYNRLVVLEELPHKQGGGHHKKFLCVCECGNLTIVQANHLLSGEVKSCGCLKIKHNKSNDKLYDCWTNIKQRCYNKNNKNYKYYGGRGIKMCQEWKDNYILFENWAIDNGYNADLTIDRIDNNGNYCPSNCRWITIKDQQLNRRNNRMVEWENQRMTLKELSDLLDIPYRLLYDRCRAKKSLKEIVNNIIGG